MGSLSTAQLNKRKIRHIDDVKPFVEVHKPVPNPSAPSLSMSRNKKFYTLPSQTVSVDVQSAAPLPLGDADTPTADNDGVDMNSAPPNR